MSNTQNYISEKEANKRVRRAIVSLVFVATLFTSLGAVAGRYYGRDEILSQDRVGLTSETERASRALSQLK